MTMLDNMKADTLTILDEWGELVTIKRASLSYDSAGMAAQSWATDSSVAGDWQPSSGDTERAEAGREIKTDAILILPFDADILEGDRVYRSDGSFEYVNYVKKFEDHITGFLTRTAGSK